MENKRPLVTVIVVTLNNSHLLRNCLESLRSQDYAPLEIVVVDNGSEEDIRGMVSESFPEIRLVRLEENQGFAGGNNRGMEQASGEYLALINNDAVASTGWVSALVATAEGNPWIGAVASIVIDGNRPEVLDSCGVGIGLDGMSRQAMRGMPVPHLTQPKEVLLFSGCACLLRRKALEEVGRFDEDFFAYCEDTDLGLRMRRAGWQIVAAPGAYVHHYYSMTGGKFSLRKIYFVERNHLWAAVKNFPTILLMSVPAVTLLRYCYQAHALLSRRGELSQFTQDNAFSAIVSTYIRAYARMLIKLPNILSRRRSARKHSRLSDRHLLELIWKYHLPLSQIIGIGNRAESFVMKG